MSKPIKKFSILDFGCGNSVNKQAYGPYSSTHYLLENGGVNAVGIDININRIYDIKNKINNGTHFIVCDGCHLPFKDKSFNYVHVEGVLHHIKQYEKAITEISRVLNGKLELAEGTNNDFIFNIGRHIVKKWRGDEIAYFKTFTLIKLLEEEFVIEDIKMYVDCPLIYIQAFFDISPINVLTLLNNYYHNFIKRMKLQDYFCSGIKVTAHSKSS